MGSGLAAAQPSNPFLEAFTGSFRGVLRWEQLDALWGTLRRKADGGWYIYTIGDEPPRAPAAPAAVADFLERVDTTLRREHREAYCGIVYADDFDEPGFVKIFDPHNLGGFCGFNDLPPLPGWILCKLPPVDLQALHDAEIDRRRHWWKRLHRRWRELRGEQVRVPRRRTPLA